MIGSIIMGILAGFIASKLTSGAGKGLLVDLFLGLLGGIVGGWAFGLLGIQAGGCLGELVCAVVGASIVLWLYAKLK
ncbi:MAG: GlsB/YeaQ/YmgE family stress response membrane protein [Prevotella sp.]|nr:GlsB/YeaQ/YmgE family stress response membrane protein [Prevotella sp.]